MVPIKLVKLVMLYSRSSYLWIQWLGFINYPVIPDLSEPLILKRLVECHFDLHQNTKQTKNKGREKLS